MRLWIDLMLYDDLSSSAHEEATPTRWKSVWPYIFSGIALNVPQERSVVWDYKTLDAVQLNVLLHIYGLSNPPIRRT